MFDHLLPLLVCSQQLRIHQPCTTLSAALLSTPEWWQNRESTVLRYCISTSAGEALTCSLKCLRLFSHLLHGVQSVRLWAPISKQHLTIWQSHSQVQVIHQQRDRRLCCHGCSRCIIPEAEQGNDKLHCKGLSY